MHIWHDSVLYSIYTLSPTHCGTGQANGAVDLPIARDRGTGLPVIPATMLKGVAREAFEKALPKGEKNPEVIRLFGPVLDKSEGDGEERDPDSGPKAGALAFTEARLLAYPARSLNRAFLHVTCPLILERFLRDLNLLGQPEFLGGISPPADWRLYTAYTVDPDLAGKALVIEDLVYPPEQVLHSQPLAALAATLAGLLPADEAGARKRLTQGLVLLPDTDLQDLLARAVPVQARIALTGGKTTDRWYNEELDRTESGNLWYEEYLPSDCLFAGFVGERRQGSFAEGPAAANRQGDLQTFRAQAELLKTVQIGGNETVGQGLCAWTLWRNGQGAAP